MINLYIRKTNIIIGSTIYISMILKVINLLNLWESNSGCKASLSHQRKHQIVLKMKALNKALYFFINKIIKYMNFFFFNWGCDFGGDIKIFFTLKCRILKKQKEKKKAMDPIKRNYVYFMD